MHSEKRWRRWVSIHRHPTSVLVVQQSLSKSSQRICSELGHSSFLSILEHLSYETTVHPSLARISLLRQENCHWLFSEASGFEQGLKFPKVSPQVKFCVSYRSRNSHGWVFVQTFAPFLFQFWKWNLEYLKWWRKIFFFSNENIFNFLATRGTSNETKWNLRSACVCVCVCPCAREKEWVIESHLFVLAPNYRCN